MDCAIMCTSVASVKVCDHHQTELRSPDQPPGIGSLTNCPRTGFSQANAQFLRPRTPTDASFVLVKTIAHVKKGEQILVAYQQIDGLNVTDHNKKHGCECDIQWTEVPWRGEEQTQGSSQSTVNLVGSTCVSSPRASQAHPPPGQPFTNYICVPFEQRRLCISFCEPVTVSRSSFECANVVKYEELSVGKVALICPRSQQQPFHDTHTVSDEDWCAVNSLLYEKELGLELTEADGNCFFHACVQFCSMSLNLPTHSLWNFAKRSLKS
jgi:hypothetical protein